MLGECGNWNLDLQLYLLCFKRTLSYCLRPSWHAVFDFCHCWFLEPWNREKSLRVIWQHFSCLLMNGLQKYIKKKKSRWLFEIIHIICFEMRMDNLKIFLGYDINYLSIWPFMRHPWFSTRKASKLTFICFQLAGWCYQLQTNVSFPASWT